jgi:hypothetical protein
MMIEVILPIFGLLGCRLGLQTTQPQSLVIFAVLGILKKGAYV